MHIAFIIIVSCILIDQITKILARKYLKGKSSKKISKNISLYYLENSGGANGLYSGNYLILIGSTIIAMFFCLLLFKHYDLNSNLLFSISLCVLVGGILGNFLDRVIYSYVTDFISIQNKKRNLPVFNFADVFIFFGSIITVITYIFI